jgi:molecular chaperone GrpE
MSPKKKKAKPKPKPKPKAEEPKEIVPGEEEITALREAAAKAEEYLDLARRAKADFLNYQERVERERSSLVKYAIEDFVRQFLTALDAVRESVRAVENGAEADRLGEGVRLIEKEFLRVLANSGVVPIEAEGKPFDPAFHEAASVVERDDVEPNTIVAEIRRGWMLRDRVLRASLVAIARPPEAAAEEGENHELRLR